MYLESVRASKFAISVSSRSNPVLLGASLGCCKVGIFSEIAIDFKSVYCFYCGLGFFAPHFPIRDDLMTTAFQDVSSSANNERQFKSPNRVLARSFRISRDAWKEKYMMLQADLKSAKQLANERGQSRDHWRAAFEDAQARAKQAEVIVQQQLRELELVRAEKLELAKKKIRH